MKKIFVDVLLSSLLGLVMSVLVEPTLKDVIAKSNDPPITSPAMPLPSPETSIVVRDPPPNPFALAEGTETRDGIAVHTRELRGENGASAWVKITTLDKEHYWKKGSASIIMGPDNQEDNIYRFLGSRGLQRDLQLAHDIVIIGAASCEFENSSDPDEAREEIRAGNRAMKMTSWLREVLERRRPDLAVFSVNLGRFRHPNCPQNDPQATRWQRGAYLVSVIKKHGIETREQLANLLRDHFSQKDNALQLDLTRYSKGDFALEPVKMPWQMADVADLATSP
jgi:hypothetical protein